MCSFFPATLRCLLLYYIVVFFFNFFPFIVWIKFSLLHFLLFSDLETIYLGYSHIMLSFHLLHLNTCVCVHVQIHVYIQHPLSPFNKTKSLACFHFLSIIWSQSHTLPPSFHVTMICDFNSRLFLKNIMHYILFRLKHKICLIFGALLKFCFLYCINFFRDV